MRVLAIDPGHDGAACLLEDGHVRDLAAWRRRKRKAGDVYEVSAVPPVMAAEVPTLARVGWWLDARIGGADALVVEGLFVPRGRSNGIISLAEATGMVIGPAVARHGHPVARPLASQWRREVLGLANRTPALDAEMAAVVEGCKRWPELRALPEWARGHAAEAAWIAEWWRTR